MSVIGGGAAGYFAAITIAETNPSLRVILLEAGSQVLRKVKISGGGRCNLTHHCFDPKELSTKYPRGPENYGVPFIAGNRGILSSGLSKER